MAEMPAGTLLGKPLSASSHMSNQVVLRPQLQTDRAESGPSSKQSREEGSVPASTNGGAQLRLHFWENLWVEHMPGSMESFSPISRCCWSPHRSHLTFQHSQTLPARWPQLNPQLNRYLLLAPNTPLWDWLRTWGGMAEHQIHTNSRND